MGAVAYWSRRAARLHSSIRGLSPQAGGFRRRSNRPSSVSRVSGLAHDPYERLPCVQQVVTSHLLFRIILQYAAVFQPRVLFLFQGNAQYITNRLYRYSIVDTVKISRQNVCDGITRTTPRHTTGAVCSSMSRMTSLLVQSPISLKVSIHPLLYQNLTHPTPTTSVIQPCVWPSIWGNTKSRLP